VIAPRTHVRVLGRRVPAFQACGVTGFGVACVLAFALVARRGLDPLVMAGLVAIAVATFLGLAWATLLAVREERLVCYHAQLAVAAVAAAFLTLTGHPVLAYLDPTVLGVGAFLAGGRVGCHLVGCCHGEPAARGVRYGMTHADEGFPAYLVGVPLVPVQLAESAFVAVATLAGAVAVAAGARPGTGVVVYAVAYAAGRGAVEAWRGDVRPSWHGVSEAQWTSLALLAAVAAGEARGTLPGPWPVPVAVALCLAVLVAWSARRARGLGGPAHVAELARAIDVARASAGEPAVAATSRGVLVSTHGDVSRVYTISLRSGTLGDEDALRLAALVVRLRDPDARWHVVRGALPVFHVVAS
jgi:hypothetical protein